MTCTKQPSSKDLSSSLSALGWKVLTASAHQHVPLSRSCLLKGSAVLLIRDPWKGSTRDTLRLPGGSLTGRSNPKLPSVAWLGRGRLPNRLSRLESMELNPARDTTEPQLWPAHSDYCFPAYQQPILREGRKKSPNQTMAPTSNFCLCPQKDYGKPQTQSYT